MKPTTSHAVDTTIDVDSVEAASSGLSAGWRSKPIVKTIGTAFVAGVVIIAVQALYQAGRDIVMKKSIEAAKAKANAKREQNEDRLAMKIGAAVVAQQGNSLGNQIAQTLSPVLDNAIQKSITGVADTLAKITRENGDNLVSAIREEGAATRKAMKVAA